MTYGLAIAGALVLLLAFFALRERLGGGERKPPVQNTGDGGVPASYAGVYGSDPSSNYPGTSTADEWDIGDKAAEDCAPADNPGDADQCDTGDSGSDGGGSDGGGDGGDGGDGGGD